ncbi:MAG: molybdate ABC transporter substrate-binding protein [Rhodospirillaceae bacterium]|nr:MAG: molybdate ABC transporter substrate-binding protein [Rhodospirillaceae bacterium]
MWKMSLSIRRTFTKARMQKGIFCVFALVVLCIPGTLLAEAPERVITPVTVYAPTSLTNVLQVVSERFAAKGLGAVLVTFASSAELEKRVSKGAPVDLLITDRPEWKEALAAYGITPTGKTSEIRGNGLVFITRKNSSIQLGIPLGLHITKNLKDRTITIGEPDNVPAGSYAREALSQLELWEALTPNFLFASDVREALTLVERGQADAGIVYATDALISDRVKVIAVIPATTHAPIRYHLVPIGTRTEPAVTNFYHFLREPEVEKIFKRFGFHPS